MESGTIGGINNDDVTPGTKKRKSRKNKGNGDDVEEGEVPGGKKRKRKQKTQQENVTTHGQHTINEGRTDGDMLWARHSFAWIKSDFFQVQLKIQDYFTNP